MLTITGLQNNVFSNSSKAICVPQYKHHHVAETVCISATTWEQQREATGAAAWKAAKPMAGRP